MKIMSRYIIGNAPIVLWQTSFTQQQAFKSNWPDRRKAIATRQAMAHFAEK
jgi:hypothetical protein